MWKSSNLTGPNLRRLHYTCKTYTSCISVEIYFFVTEILIERDVKGNHEDGRRRMKILTAAANATSRNIRMIRETRKYNVV